VARHQQLVLPRLAPFSNVSATAAIPTVVPIAIPVAALWNATPIANPIPTPKAVATPRFVMLFIENLAFRF
jgi:hypothetical protein